MALACAEARAADFSDAASDQQYIDALNGSAIRFDRERQRVISRERLDAIRESRMVGLPSCGTQLGRSALFVDDLDPLVDHFAGEPVESEARAFSPPHCIEPSYSICTCCD